MSDVFISYSRKDSKFVRILHKALEESNRETWVDWKGIGKGTEWWKEIEEGIEGANTFVFVISPDSVASEVCQKEINHAKNYNKQILPIVYRDAYELLEKENSAHQAISSHNWLFFRDTDTDSFEKSFQELIDALNLNIAYVKEHTRLLMRALEWDKKGRKEYSLLLGEELIDAEKWLNDAEEKLKATADASSKSDVGEKWGVADFEYNFCFLAIAKLLHDQYFRLLDFYFHTLIKQRQKSKQREPEPTELQATYIKKSREVEDANNQATKILQDANEEAAKRIELANLQVNAIETKTLWLQQPTELNTLFTTLKMGLDFRLKK